eukprot:7046140-Prymnesium_polylepis.1
MIDDLRLGIVGLPPTVLEKLEDAREEAAALDHKWFNKPQQHNETFQKALQANDTCYELMATDEAWAGVEGGNEAVAGHMRGAAKKCAEDDRPSQAAALLTMAVRRAGVPQEHKDK